MRRTRAVGLAVLSLTIAALLAVTGAAIAGPGKQQQLATVKVGVPALTLSASVYLGILKGFFAQQGINLQTVTVQGQAATAAALASGAIDMGLNTAVPLILATAAGQGQQIVSPIVGLDPRIEKLIVATGSTIRRPRDLAGKRIAVASLNSVQQLAGTALVAADGGDPRTIQWLPVGNPATGATLLSGQADAAMVVQPFLGVALATGRVRPLLNNYYVGLGSRPPGAVFAARSDWVQSNLAVARRFATAMTRSNDYANKHRREAKALLPSFIPTLTAETAQQQVLSPWTQSVSVSGLRRMITLMVNHGFIRSAITPGSVLCSCARTTR